MHRLIVLVLLLAAALATIARPLQASNGIILTADIPEYSTSVPGTAYTITIAKTSVATGKVLASAFEVRCGMPRMLSIFFFN